MARPVGLKIPVACPCGLVFEVPSRYAGRTVECAACYHPLLVPDAGPDSQELRRIEISVLCECGKRLKASAAFEGRVGKCPGCGRRLRLRGHKETRPLTKAEWMAGG